MTTTRIGTSGWQYSHWRGPFYPPELKKRQWFEHYVARFDCVEINNSFYRLPSAETLAEWRDSTSPGFELAMKAPRQITHMKKLKNAAQPLETFLERVGTLGDRLGPLLYQLPPNWRCNLDRLHAFLEQLPDDFRHTIEFRDASWHNEDVYAALREHNVAFCVYDLAGFESPDPVTADFVYVRLHGPGKDAYTGSYTPQKLGAWARRIAGWRRKRRDVYVFFDNDEAGYAAKNALALARQVKRR